MQRKFTIKQWPGPAILQRIKDKPYWERSERSQYILDLHEDGMRTCNGCGCEMPDVTLGHLVDTRSRHYGAYCGDCLPEADKRVKSTRLEAVKRYSKANPEKLKANWHRRRARKLGALGSYTPEQLQARFDYYGNRCIYCGDQDTKLTIEHLIPLSRGGTNWPSNLAPSCKSCNCKKHTKTHKEYMRDL